MDQYGPYDSEIQLGEEILNKNRRREVEKRYESPNTLNIFTDGSKIMDGVGAGTYCVELDIRRPVKLPDYCSIFQAEVFAVGKAAEIALARTSSNPKINI